LTYNGAILKDVVSESNPKILNVGPGIKGLVDKFHEVFKPTVQSKFIDLYYVRSIPVGAPLYLGNITHTNPSKDSDYLTIRKLTSGAFSLGEIEIDDLGDIDKEIEDAQKEIDRLEGSIEVS